MRRIIRSWLMALPLSAFLVAPLVAGQFEDAAATYRSGDYATALQQFHSLADQGDVRARNNLGLMYDTGQGVLKNYNEAAKWFRLAADQGDANAQTSLGAIYLSGQGVPQDFAAAMKWYRLAAGQGFAPAQVNLGAMYLKGLGVPEDLVEAAKWYRLAADQGYADAQFALGALYEDGHGVPKDYVRAHMWFSLAALLYPASDAAIRGEAIKFRDELAAKMTRAQIVQAQALASQWHAIAANDDGAAKNSGAATTSPPSGRTLPGPIPNQPPSGKDPFADIDPQMQEPGAPKPHHVNMFDDIDPLMPDATPEAVPAHVNMFADMPEAMPGRTTGPGAAASHAGPALQGDDPFADVPPVMPERTMGLTAAAAHGARELVPIGAGMLGAGLASAGAGAAFGALGGPPGSVVGGVLGFVAGVGGFFGGSYLAEGAQDYAIHQMPDNWQDAIGQSDRYKRLSEQQHPVVVFIGRWAPYAAAISLLIWWWWRRNVMSLASRQAVVGDGGAKISPAVENVLTKKPQVNRRLQITLTITIVLLAAGMAVFRTMNPMPDDRQARLELYSHPVASIAGSLLPIVVFAPLAYWMFGRISRRIAARYKVCEFCAETIKSQAKVCRYCGRTVAPSASGTTQVPAATDAG